MDFNTGRGEGRPDDQSRPLYSEGAGGRPVGGPERRPVGSPGGGEFNLQDPINSFISTVRALVLDPVGFFRGIARRGDFVNPLIFAAICALISALLGGIISLILSPLFVAPGDTGEALAGGVVGFVFSLIFALIFVVIGLFVGAAITQLLVMLLVRPQNAGFEATFRVGAYIQAVQLISWIPIIGWIIAFVWAIVLYILGLREVHSTTTGRAALVVLIPFAIVILLVVLFLAVIAALVGGAIMSESQQF
jgi:hypothetical protein